MKKLIKSLFICLLVLLCTVTLTGCKKIKNQLADANDKIAELEAALDAANKAKDEANAAKDQTAAELAEVQAAKEAAESANAALQNSLNASNAEKTAAAEKLAALEATYKAAVIAVANGKKLSFDEEQLAKYFGEEGYAEIGVKYELAVNVTYSYTPEGAEEPVLAETYPAEAGQVVLDYFWDNTADYNNGIDIAGTAFTPKLLGVHYVAAILAEEVTDAEGNVDASYAAYNMLAAGAHASGTFIAVENIPGAYVGVGATYEDILEGKPGETFQLAVSEGYTIKECVTSNASVATVNAAGLITAVAAGDATITVTIEGENVTRTKTVALTVINKVDAELAAGGAEGAYYNFKYASVDTQAKILAYMERALINAGASIPVYNNSGLVIYSERVNFIADEYVAQMGYGPTAVAPDTGKGAGTAEDPAYRMWTSADPSTLNHLNYADSVESDFLSVLAGQLVAFDWKVDENGKGIGWEIKPEMLSVLPYAVEQNEAGEWVEVENFSGLNQYKTWKFDLRQDLKWENGDPMNANDFIYTYKLVLDPVLNMKRANYFYGGDAPIEGAAAYFNQTADAPVSWDTVGIKQVDDYSFVFIYKDEIKLWDVEYAMSGFLYTPVHKATWEACLSEDGTSTSYGTSMDTYMASGAYKLSYWEKGREYRFTKNDQYFVWNEAAEDVQVRRPCYENYSYVIVKDSNAALELFKAGELDVTSVPASAYDDFKDYPSQKFSPGATSFRLSVNRMTQAELDATFGAGSWDAKEILQEDDFMWALYFGLDRAGVQAITKTSTAWASYFTNAYSIVTPTEEGVGSATYRETEWGKKVYEGLASDDYDLLYDDLGYAPGLAKDFYIYALDSMAEKGVFDPAKPYAVEVEIAAFDGATTEAVYAYVAQVYNELFNSEEVKAEYPNVTFKATFVPQPGMDVYYVKQMTGQYDLALAGISGGTMSPAGFMECFCDDNRSGLLLSLGFDSHNANILIDLDVDGDGVNDGEKYWSFDALYSALMGETFVKEGKEAEAPVEEEAE